ncbi:MAG: polysaccharide export protein [Hyphomicrobiales bacterium]|nr:polysaccharide export protein [Hyphomicrobiales bacterium]
MRLVLVAALCATIAGCNTSKKSEQADKALSELTTLQAFGANDTKAAADYKIQPADVLEISVFQVPDLSKTVEVNSSGRITLPLIGQMVAQGKTVPALESTITAKLKDTYLQAPEVSVFVKENPTQRIAVSGAVNAPGVYPLKGRTTLLQAIATAGGLDRQIADPSGIVVLRRVDGKQQVAKFDYKAMGRGDADDPILQAGDIVKVDQSGFRSVLSGIRETIPVFGLFTPFL